ncbi:MAG: AraC family transcriptional regulator [Lentisphaerae bacterium]|nr:AraC family transcriptional regulator [Lentisphaerota bacterium]
MSSLADMSVLRWPVRVLPVIHEAGRYPLDEAGFESTYRHPTHALHLHAYRGTWELNGRRFPLQPGCVTISPARAATRYDLPHAGHHWCIHFHPVPARGPLAPIPLHALVPPQREYVAVRMAEIAWHFNQPRSALAQGRAAALLQDLLLGMAARATASPRPAGRADAALDHLIALIDERFAETWSVPRLAQEVGLSQDHLARCFRRRMGMTVPHYLLHRRITHARELLQNTDLPVNRIAARVGMPDPQHFNKQFRRLTGHSPSAGRRR